MAPLISIYKLHWPDLLRRLDEFVGVLSMEEQERASRFHFNQDRQRFILCRAWLRCILGNIWRCRHMRWRSVWAHTGNRLLMARGSSI